MFLTFGYIDKLVHDRATYFSSTYFRQFLFDPTSPHDPSSNLCERQNRNIIQMLIYYIEKEQKTWAHAIWKWQQTLTLTINDINESTQIVPCEIFMGWNFINPPDSRYILNYLLLDNARDKKERLVRNPQT